MAGNVTGLHVFQNAISPEPLKYLDDNYSTLQTTLNTLNTFANFLVDTGTPNNLNVTAASSQYVSYSDGLQVLVRIGNTNTGPSTLNINNMGPKQIIFPNGSALSANALPAGSIQTFVYNASLNAFQLIGITGGALTVTAPFAANDSDGQPLFQINVPPVAATELGEKCLVIISPGSHGTIPGDIGTMLCIWGAEDAYGLKVQVGGPTTQPVWAAQFVNANTSAAPAGIENGVHIIAGSNSGDSALRVDKRDLSSNFLNLEGDGAGAIGPSPNQLVWDTAGHFTLTGTATLPWPAIDNLPDITITNPVQGDVLSWDATTQKWVNAAPVSAVATLTDVHLTNPQNGEALVYDQATNSWVNGAPVNALATLNDVALSNPLTGQTLTYNAATQRWVNSTPVTALPQLSDVHLAGPVSGQVLTYSVSPQPGWVNATIPGYTFLTNLGVGPNPAPGWVLTWDGQAWVGAAPGEVATFPLSSLTDVGITTPLNRQVLTYDAPSGKWINAPAASPALATLPDVALTSQTQGQVLAWDATLNRWVNSALPGGSVIALDTLMDTNISDPQNNQVLTWDYASARWVNRSPVTNLSALSDVTLTSPASGQVLAYTGTHWVNTTPVSVTVAATAPANPQSGWLWWDTIGGQLYVWYPNQWVTANPSPAPPSYTLAHLTDVALSSPANGQALTYNGTVWANSNVFTGPVTVAGASLGISIKAGAAATDKVLQVQNAAGSNILVVNGDGTGYLTPTAGSPAGTNSLNWNGSGDFAIGTTAPSTGATAPRVIIQGRGQNQTLVVQASGGQDWIARFLTGTSTGTSYGVVIQAGTLSSDPIFVCQPNAGADALSVMGDGSVWARRITNKSGTTLVSTPAGEVSYWASSARFKTDIRSVPRSLAREIIKRVRVTSFRSTSEGEDPDRTHYGLVAEEVEQVDSGLVSYGQDGKVLGVHYDRIAMLLLPLVQELLGMDEPEGVY